MGLFKSKKEKMQEGYDLFEKGKLAAAFLKLRKFADKGDARSQYCCGMYFFEHSRTDSTQSDKQRHLNYAQAYFTLAAENGYAEAEKMLDEHFRPKKAPESEENIQPKAEETPQAAPTPETQEQQTPAPEPEAQPEEEQPFVPTEPVDQYLYQGVDAFNSQNYEQALELFQKAEELGSVNAQHYIGVMYTHGLGVEQNNDTALEWYFKAAANGFPDSQLIVSAYYYDAKNYDEAFKCYSFLAENGIAEAQYRLGKMYALGQGTEFDGHKAFEWNQKAVDQNYADAICELAGNTELGLYTKKDISEAIRLYKRAAELGSDSAAISLGKMYFNGEDVKKDYEEAKKWLIPPADKGYTYASLLLGEIYLQSPSEGKLAMKYLEKAASNNWNDAMKLLAKAYADGLDGSKNYTEAAKWYKLSVEKHKDKDSMYELGLLYREGKGVEKDEKYAQELIDRSGVELINNIAKAFTEEFGELKDLNW